LNNEIHISWSEISDFLSCNYKHYLGYTKKLKTSSDTINLIFGKVIHSVLESFLKKEIKSVELIKVFNSKFVTLENIKNYTPESVYKFQKQGISILTEIITKYSWDTIEVLHTELPLYEHIYLEFYFKGIIDLVYKHKGYYWIADWKTATNKWNDFKFRDEYYGWQLLYYKYFFHKKYKIPLEKIKTCFILLNRNDNEAPNVQKTVFLNVPSDSKRIEPAIRKLYEILNTIYSQSNENCLRRTIGYNCNICEFNQSKHCSGNEKTEYSKKEKKKIVVEKATTIAEKIRKGQKR